MPTRSVPLIPRCAFWQAAFLALIPLVALGAVDPALVRELRHWSLDSRTRIAIETTGEVGHHVELLENPDRLVLDLLDANLAPAKGRSFRLPVSDSLVKQIRVAQTPSQVTRVVLDLNQPVEFEVSQLANPNRVMVEVRSRAAVRAAQAALTTSALPPKRPPVLDKPAAAVPAPEAGTIPSAAPQKLNPPPIQTASLTPTPVPIAGSSTMPPKPGVPGATQEKAGQAPRQAQDATRNLTRTLGLKLGRVVIDPGHGGNDHGTTGPTGLREKDLVLDVAMRLGMLLEERLGTNVVYTRRDDNYLPLTARTATANRQKADLFLSIHANASPGSEASGAEVFYLNFTTSKVDLAVAARENAGHDAPIHELQNMIRKIALTEKLDESRAFAGGVQTQLHRFWSKQNTEARNRGVKKAPFVVLIGAAMPSILAEIGFISNPKDEATLKKPEVRQKLAEALFRGVSQYANTLSRFDLAAKTVPDE